MSHWLANLTACRVVVLFVAGGLHASCISVKHLNESLEGARIDLSLSGQDSPPFREVSIPAAISIDSIRGPAFFPPVPYSRRTFFFVVPLIVFYAWQANYEIHLGNSQFIAPLGTVLADRFEQFIRLSEDEQRMLEAGRYSLRMDIQAVETRGMYANGGYVGIFYGTYSGVIDQGRNSTAAVRIGWELRDRGVAMEGGSVFIHVKDHLLARPTGYIVNNGVRTELGKDDWDYLPYVVEYPAGTRINMRHCMQMVRTLCLGFDKASSSILSDVDRYFRRSAAP